MKTKISIFYNPENDDLFAGIISKPYKDSSKIELQSYAIIGQHSLMRPEYVLDSLDANIDENSFELYVELKSLYEDADFIQQYQFREILNELN